MSKKIKNEELQNIGAIARRHGETLQSNPYRYPSQRVREESISQSMREHKAKQWEIGWKKEDVIRRA